MNTEVGMFMARESTRGAILSINTEKGKKKSRQRDVN